MTAITGTNQKELMELVQQHFPTKGYVEIRAMLNQCQAEIGQKSYISRRTDTGITTVAGTRFYDIDTDVVNIERVELTDSAGNYYTIPRILNPGGTEE